METAQRQAAEEQFKAGLISLTELDAKLGTVFHVVDRKTGYTMATCKNRKSANRKMDKLDNIYGGYRYGVQAV